MPRVKRVGHRKRNAEVPLAEWTPAELEAELERLEESPEDLNVWAAFKRKSEILNEQRKRFFGGTNNAGK